MNISIKVLLSSSTKYFFFTSGSNMYLIIVHCIHNIQWVWTQVLINSQGLKISISHYPKAFFIEISIKNSYKIHYCKRWLLTLVVKYVFSLVNQYAWVLNTRLRDLPHSSFGMCNLTRGSILRGCKLYTV